MTVGAPGAIIIIEHLFAYHEERKVFDMVICATETIVVSREGERVSNKGETREQTIHTSKEGMCGYITEKMEEADYMQIEMIYGLVLGLFQK